MSDGGYEIFPHLHPQLFLVCVFIIGGVCKRSLQQISNNHDFAIYSRDPSVLVSLKHGNNTQWIYKQYNSYIYKTLRQWFAHRSYCCSSQYEEFNKHAWRKLYLYGFAVSALQLLRQGRAVIWLTAEHQPVTARHNTKWEMLRLHLILDPWEVPLSGTLSRVQAAVFHSVKKLLMRFVFILGPKTVFFWAPIFKWVS